jgi:hypothetical protein
VPPSSIYSFFFRLKRLPFKIQDIDIVVSEQGSWDAEEIKEVIVESDDRYYLEPSRKRGETYQKLYCRLPGWTIDEGRRIKIDILVPPSLKLPEITEFDAVHLDGMVDIPVMPLFDLLVMKTQGWWDHRRSPRRDWQAKESTDVSDILALLKRARKERVSYDDEADEYRHSQQFMSHARTLAIRFVDVNGWDTHWRALGFPDV